MKVKFANRIYEVLFTKELAGLTMYAVEDEPNHIDWLIHVEVIDAENRQLRKIESRQEELTEFEKAVKQVMKEAIECGDTHNLKADADMLLRLVQKPAWSEEDEAKFESCIKVLQTSDGYDTINTKWLKSIKDKYTWKPSERQKEALLWCVIHLGGADKQTLGELLEKLNKL